MFLKYLDYLSPSITLYYKGFLSHNSIVSGIISIISILCLINLAAYFSLEIFLKEDPTNYYYNIFIEDSGIYQINTSSFFHFLTYSKNKGNETIEETLDLKKFNVIGTNDHYNKFIGYSNRTSKGINYGDHWLYGHCDKEKNIYVKDNYL